MTRSSPTRRSQLLSSPDRGYISSFLCEPRNHESTHRDALAAAQEEHNRVREAAIRVYELHELKEEHERILKEERREQERLKAEAQIAAEQKRLQELRAKTIPKPPPPPPPPPEPEPAPVQPVQPPPEKAAPPNVTEAKAPKEPPKQEPVKQETPPVSQPQTNGLFSDVAKPPQSSSPQPVNTAAPKPSPFGVQPQPTPAAAAPKIAPAAQIPQDPILERYVQIHQALKKLRKDITALSKTPGSPLKGTMGTYRREIRVAIGQLTSGKGANAQPVSVM